MQIKGIKTSVFEEGDSLIDFINEHIPMFCDGDVLTVTSKIVALSERRVADKSEMKTIIAKESYQTIETPWAILTLADDGWGINAGIDESNADQSIILLPKNPFKTAKMLCDKIKNQHKLKKFGVIITDTRSTPLRIGTIGRAIAYAGFKPLKDYIGEKDLYGRKSRVTQSNHVDALAAVAVCVMGEGDEQIPLVHISSAPVSFTKKPLSKKDTQLFLLPENDIFSYIFKSSKSESCKSQKDK